MGKPANQLSLEVAANTGYPEAAEFLADIVADIHARVIGAGGPVQITGPQMVNIVRDQNVAELPAVTLPVEEVGILDTMRTVLQWFVPIAAVLGLAAVVLGVLAHPERADAIFGIGVLCILAGVLAMILGYVVPTFLLPLLTDNVWIEVIPAAANNELRTVAVLSCALAIVGVVLILGSAGFRRRKTGLVVTGSRRPLQRTATLELIGSAGQSLGGRQREDEAGPAFDAGVDDQRAPVTFDDVAGDAQPEPGTTVIGGSRRVEPGEPLEDQLGIGSRDAGPVVLDHD